MIFCHNLLFALSCSITDSYVFLFSFKGAGTALGELPPYFMAKAGNKSSLVKVPSSIFVIISIDNVGRYCKDIFNSIFVSLGHNHINVDIYLQ